MNILTVKLLCTFMIMYNSSPSSIKEGKEMVQSNGMIYVHDSVKIASVWELLNAGLRHGRFSKKTLFVYCNYNVVIWVICRYF